MAPSDLPRGGDDRAADRAAGMPTVVTDSPPPVPPPAAPPAVALAPPDAPPPRTTVIARSRDRDGRGLPRPTRQDADLQEAPLPVA